MSIQFKTYDQKRKVKGFGGLFVLKKKLSPTIIPSDVSIVKTTSANEGKKIGEITDIMRTDSDTNLKQEILNGNQLNMTESNTTIKKDSKRKTSENVKSLPKSKKTKIEDMKLFNANYF